MTDIDAPQSFFLSHKIYIFATLSRRQYSLSEKLKNMSITILGIESSCDDTSSAVIRDGVLLSNVIAGQAVHEAYGGVVPELASRAHQQNMQKLLLMQSLAK